LRSSLALWRGLVAAVISAAATSRQQHNKALHPTAASLVLFAALRLYCYVTAIGRRRVSLVVLPVRPVFMSPKRRNAKIWCRRPTMIQTIEALIDENGSVSLLEEVHLPSARRALVTILEQPATDKTETALLSEAALAADWNRPEEDEAWSHLQRA